MPMPDRPPALTLRTASTLGMTTMDMITAIITTTTGTITTTVTTTTT